MISFSAQVSYLTSSVLCTVLILRSGSQDCYDLRPRVDGRCPWWSPRLLARPPPGACRLAKSKTPTLAACYQVHVWTVPVRKHWLQPTDNQDRVRKRSGSSHRADEGRGATQLFGESTPSSLPWLSPPSHPPLTPLTAALAPFPVPASLLPLLATSLASTALDLLFSPPAQSLLSAFSRILSPLLSPFLAANPALADAGRIFLSRYPAFAVINIRISSTYRDSPFLSSRVMLLLGWMIDEWISTLPYTEYLIGYSNFQLLLLLFFFFNVFPEKNQDTANNYC